MPYVEQYSSLKNSGNFCCETPTKAVVIYNSGLQSGVRVMSHGGAGINSDKYF
jgi:hypothetical protein